MMDSVSEIGGVKRNHVDEPRQRWVANPTVVRRPAPDFKGGDAVQIDDDVYLRADSATAQRNEAPTIGVIRAGESVVVEDVAYTHSLRGGWFLWLKIKAQ